MNRRPLLRLPFALLLAAALGACTTGDEESFTPRPFLVDSGTAIRAVSYGPHRDGQAPGGTSPSAAEIREDLRLMAPHWNLLRIYGSGGFAETLLKLIREEELEIQVMVGAWIAPEAPAANRRELEAAIHLAGKYPDLVSALCIGNETQVSWSGHRSSLDSLILHVRRARAAVTLPVTVADDFNFWNKPESRRLAAEIDFITWHAHPMWNGKQREEALPWLRSRLAEARDYHPDREVLIGETGWATSVHDQGEQAQLIKGAAGESEQARFHADLLEWVESEGETVFVFEAFDENWKGGPHPDEVEKHWGLFRADRSPKAAMQAAPALPTRP